MRVRTLVGLALGAATARAAYAALTARPPAGAATWTRTNHRGESLTLLEGPAVAVSASVAGAAVVPGRLRAAALLAGLGSGALGAYDDLAGSGDSRGFKGHLGALARGQVTSGAVKILGIGATGLAAAALARPRPRVADVIIDGGVIAGGANLLNLFDLRPGRAVKVAALTGTPLALTNGPGGAAAAATLGSATALLNEDLGERAMLGDAGANAVGALLGLAAVTTLPRAGRIAALTVIAGLTAASEKVSFTKVIANTPPLNKIDMLGRRPAAPRPHDPEPVETSGAALTP